jgi:hypothetical protein
VSHVLWFIWQILQLIQVSTAAQQVQCLPLQHPLAGTAATAADRALSTLPQLQLLYEPDHLLVTQQQQ